MPWAMESMIYNNIVNEIQRNKKEKPKTSLTHFSESRPIRIDPIPFQFRKLVNV
jgi:hypothetical protein